MRKMFLSIALAVVAPFAWGKVSKTTTTTTTTEGNGTITEYTPGSAIVLRESSGPRRYRFGKTVTYVTRSGRTLDEDTVRTRIKVGVPVRVHYVGTGDTMMVDRVILESADINANHVRMASNSFVMRSQNNVDVPLRRGRTKSVIDQPGALRHPIHFAHA